MLSHRNTAIVVSVGDTFQVDQRRSEVVWGSGKTIQTTFPCLFIHNSRLQGKLSIKFQLRNTISGSNLSNCFQGLQRGNLGLIQSSDSGDWMSLSNQHCRISLSASAIRTAVTYSSTTDCNVKLPKRFPLSTKERLHRPSIASSSA